MERGGGGEVGVVGGWGVEGVGHDKGMAVAAEELETLFLYLGGHALAVLPGVHLSFGCVDVGRAGARRWRLQGRAELLAYDT